MLQKFITLSLIVLVVAGMPLDAKKKESQEAVLLNCGPSGHPLDPLTCVEINAVRAVIELQKEREDGAIYTDIILKEPSKKSVLAFEQNPGRFTREAQVILYNNATAETFEYIVYVCGTTASLKSKKKLCGVIPNMNFINNTVGSGEDPEYIEDLLPIVLASPNLVAALQEAYPNENVLQLLNAEVIYPTWNTFESFRSQESTLRCCPEVIGKKDPKHRYFPITFADTRVLDPYAPEYFSIVHGVEGILDATAKKIVAVIKVNPSSVAPVNLEEAPSYVHIGSQEPIIISSKANYTIANNVVTWDNWKFRLGWHPHAGLELYQIQYWDQKTNQTVDEGKYRSILYKASLSDAIVAYNVGSEILFARNYLSGDTFHYPWMRRFAPLCKGRDVPNTDSLTLLPMFLADTDGNPVEFKDSVAIYEQDADILWRTASPISGGIPTCVEGARGRQLVVRTIFQGTYYLWVVSWIFNQDGSMNVGVDVGGRTQNIIIPEDSHGHEDFIWGEVIAPQEFALTHTHIYNFRLDFDIDGTKNTVIEENQETINNRRKNPCGQAVGLTERVLKTEQKAIRDMNLESNRQWIVINPAVKNYVGHEVGYELLPQKNGFDKSADYSTLHQQFSFLKHHLHVTRYHDEEKFASGSMPILQDKDTGLGAYVKNDECIENEDVVVWYTLNFSHVPHSEDYPTISLYRQGFSLVPHNFFDSNPGLSIKTVPTTCLGDNNDQCSNNEAYVYPIPCVEDTRS